jgi:sec-independent protein translocase protein TatA
MLFSKFGIWEALIILVVVLIIFGVGKLPQVGSAIGKGIRAFRRGQSGEAPEEAEEEAEKQKVLASARKKRTTRKTAKS